MRDTTSVIENVLNGHSASVVAETGVTPQEAHEIGLEAYLYLYPLVTMEMTRRVMTNVPPGVKPGLGPMNAFHHIREFPESSFRAVVRPNFDTLYSSAWVDVTREPAIVTVPDTGGRYYFLPMLDMWTDVFAVPGKRTSGTRAGHYAIVCHGWTGRLPGGVQRIETPTPLFWMTCHTQTNGPADYDAVHELQDGLAIGPLSHFGKKFELPRFSPDSAIDMKTPPMMQVNMLPAGKYFALAAHLMKINPPHITDWSILARIRRIGIVPGQPFDLNALDPDVHESLERVPVDALMLMQDKVSTLARVTNGWQMKTGTTGVFGNNYLERAVIAMTGFGANPCEDAVCLLNAADAGGKPVTGSHRYVMHFAKDQMPPVDAFWSISMVDEEGSPIANRIDRYAIGDHDALKFNKNGSLDVYIQNQNPGKGKESNWLPSPGSGALGITMRLYAPKPQVLDGSWAPPPVRRVSRD